MSLIPVAPGAILLHRNARVRVICLLAADQALVEPFEGSDAYRASVSQLSVVPSGPEERPAPLDLAAIKDSEWDRLAKEIQLLWPIVEAPRGGVQRLVTAAATELKRHPATIWRHVADFRSHGFRPTALLRQSPGPAPNVGRYPPKTEEIIARVLNDRYLVRERPTIRKVWGVICRECEDAKTKKPRYDAVRRRVQLLKPDMIIRRRYGPRRAREKLTGVPGRFPPASRPLEVVMIDHTMVDVNVVDDVHRESIGTPWITIAIDVYTRCIWSIYVSLRRPQTSSLAIIMARGLMPKDDYLKSLGIKGRWPVYGPPERLSFDGAAEFQSAGFVRGCVAHGVRHVKPRPPGRPNWGGIIESFIGKLMGEVRMLRGRVSKNNTDRRDYRNDKKACMTVTELERWIVTNVVFKYHQRIHSAIGEPPIVRYERDIVKDGKLPPIPSDPHRLLLDFMPMRTGALHLRGFRWNPRWYWGDVLQDYINMGVPRKITVRRDPRNESIAYVLRPDGKAYAKIAATEERAISVENSRRAKAYLKSVGQEVYEASLHAADAELDRQEREAATRTKSARRRQQQRREAVVAQPGPSPEAEASDDARPEPRRARAKARFAEISKL